MKPHEAAGWLRLVAQAVVIETSLQPSLRIWFKHAVDKRLADPDTHLDQLLGLRTRAAGRLTLHCQLPRRDAALRILAATITMPSTQAKADEILRLQAAGELAHIEKFGPIPGRRQLLRILTHDT